MHLSTAHTAASRSLATIVAVVALVGSSGCGRGRTASGTNAPAPSATMTVDSDDQLKQRLQSMIDSGVAGSAVGGLPEFIAKHAKQKELMIEFKKLQSASTPDQVKAAAKAMLGKL